ncbi:MAG: lysine 2,3-aminomutase [Desulfobacterales bacterium]
MTDTGAAGRKKIRLYNRKNFRSIGQLGALPRKIVRGIETAAAVFPFRVNNYILDELIDWHKVPEDPIFRLTFPQSGMLVQPDRERIERLFAAEAPPAEIGRAAKQIQMKLNPHPAGQMQLNVPVENGKVYHGMQHKYRQTVLFFPSHGQTCHAYCTYCFRWAQFAGLDGLKFMNKQPQDLVEYLERHPEVSDVLYTGGDPLTMSTRLIRRYVAPLLDQRPEGLATIRFGSKALAYWPYRFLTDPDAEDLLRLFEEITAKGFHLALMAHFSHPRELETPAVQAAIRRILATGAQIRCQAPLVRHVNDKAEIWRDMWHKQVNLGAIPYYMFIPRDTGPQQYFEVPLVRAYRLFSEAYRQVSGLSRTVRGPSMSATPGKVLIDGITNIGGERVFVLKFIQGRDPDWVNRIFFARYDESASWLDDLRPAFGEKQFFFKRGLRLLKSGGSERVDQRRERLTEEAFEECA